ncbi:MFS transporter [Sphingobium sp.]|uniref:MFS transporter n=1 Tax=Sphingobium sp. TaxID=1912891 RepID=UPI0028BDF637|nr:MFS transporter [Sphingobium sp.]
MNQKIAETSTIREELRRGRRVIAGSFFGVAACYASVYFYSAGLFIKPLADTFGWSRAEASLGPLAGVIGAIIALPFAGSLIDRFGALRVALFSIVGFSASLALLGLFTQNLTSYLLLIGLMTALATGSNFIPYNRIIVHNFKKARGIALGLALTGTGIGGALVPVFMAPYIAEAGWRAAFYVLAAMALCLGLFAMVILRGTEGDAPPESGARVALSEIVTNKAFLSISALICLVSTAVPGTTLHLVPMMTDRGMDVATAGAIASAFGISVMLARLVTGYLLDRWNAGIVTAVLLVLVALGMALLSSGSLLLLILGALLVGFGLGTEGDLTAYLIGRRFPVEQFGRAYSSLLAIHAAASAVGGYAAGRLYDTAHSYTLWLSLAGMALLGAAALAFATERRAVGSIQQEPVRQAA